MTVSSVEIAATTTMIGALGVEVASGHAMGLQGTDRSSSGWLVFDVLTYVGLPRRAPQAPDDGCLGFSSSALRREEKALTKAWTNGWSLMYSRTLDCYAKQCRRLMMNIRASAALYHETKSAWSARR